MIESFIYSVNTVLPIFIMVIFGWVLKATSFFKSEFFASSEKLVFKFALPALLFLEISQADATNVFDIGLVGFCVVGIGFTFLIPCLIVPLFVKSNDKRGAFIQGVYRSNFAILGVPLAENMFGNAGVEQIAMVLPFAITLFNVFAVIVLSIYAPEDEKQPIKIILKNIILNIIKNPLIISVVLAIPFLIFDLQLPLIVNKSLNYISNLCLPLSLMSLGASFTFSSLKGRFSLALTASILKTVILPLATVGVALALGFRDVQLGIIFILFGGPTAVSSYIMAKSMKSDYYLAGQILLLTTIMCIITIFAGIFALRALKYI